MVGANIMLDDAAASLLPDSTALSSGTFKTDQLRYRRHIYGTSSRRAVPVTRFGWNGYIRVGLWRFQPEWNLEFVCS